MGGGGGANEKGQRKRGMGEVMEVGEYWRGREDPPPTPFVQTSRKKIIPISRDRPEVASP